MTYLETPIFQTEKSVNNKEIYRLIKIPKKYKKNYGYMESLICIIPTMICAIVITKHYEEVSSYYIKAILVILGTVIFCIASNKTIYIKNQSIKDLAILSILMIDILLMVGIFYLLNGLNLEITPLNQEILCIIIMLFIYLISHNTNILPFVLTMQLLYNIFSIWKDNLLSWQSIKDHQNFLAFLKNIILTLMSVLTLFLIFCVFKISKIYANIVFFAERQKIGNEPELTESRVIILADALNKYIKYSEDNKLKVELINNKPFLKFLKNIYLKNDSESAENKKVIESFLNNIDKPFPQNI